MRLVVARPAVEQVEFKCKDSAQTVPDVRVTQWQKMNATPIHVQVNGR